MTYVQRATAWLSDSISRLFDKVLGANVEESFAINVQQFGRLAAAING
jgi:hypothetical protein